MDDLFQGGAEEDEKEENEDEEDVNELRKRREGGGSGGGGGGGIGGEGGVLLGWLRSAASWLGLFGTSYGEVFGGGDMIGEEDEVVTSLRFGGEK